VALSPDGAPLMPVQLTARSEHSVRRAAWRPDGKRIITAADYHGNENMQLYQSPAPEGWSYAITNRPDARFELGFQPFRSDGRYIAYASNERKPSDFDVLIRNLDSGASRTLISGDAMYFAASWSPDGQSVLVLKETSNSDQDLYLCEVMTGECRHLTAHSGEIRFSPGPWKSDGSGFYMLCDRDREYLGLAFVDIRNNRAEWVETPDWDVEEVDISPDDKYLAVVTNENGYSVLRVSSTGSKAARQ
jgi:Tol biopolymer transport system component